VRTFFTSGQRRYALVFAVAAVSLGVMGARCQPPKSPPPPSDLSTRPASWNFGNQEVGGIDTEQFTVTNNGSGTTGPLAVNVQGADPGEFGFFGPPCAGNTLGPGDTCSQGVFYGPTKLGPVSASLVFTASPGGTVTAGLQGTGSPPQ
jgi:hypothetical protein